MVGPAPLVVSGATPVGISAGTSPPADGRPTTLVSPRSSVIIAATFAANGAPISRPRRGASGPFGAAAAGPTQAVEAGGVWPVIGAASGREKESPPRGVMARARRRVARAASSEESKGATRVPRRWAPPVRPFGAA